MVGRDESERSLIDAVAPQNPIAVAREASKLPLDTIENFRIISSWPLDMQMQFYTQMLGIAEERASIFYSMVRQGLANVDMQGAINKAAKKAAAVGKSSPKMVVSAAIKANELRRANPEKMQTAATWLSVPLVIALGWTVFSMSTGMGLGEGIGYGVVRTIQATAPTPEKRSDWQDLWNAWQGEDWKKVNELMPDVIDTTWDVFAGHAMDLGITTVAVGVANALPRRRERNEKEKREGKKRIKKPTAKIVTFGDGAVIKALTHDNEKNVYHIVGRMDEKRSLQLGDTYPHVNLDLLNGQSYDDSQNWNLVHLDSKNVTNGHILIVASGTTQDGMLSSTNTPETRAVGLRNLRQGTEWVLNSLVISDPKKLNKVVPVPILISRNTTVTDARSGSRTRLLSEVAAKRPVPVLILDPFKELAKELAVKLSHNGSAGEVVPFSFFSRNPDFHKMGQELADIMNSLKGAENRSKFTYCTDPNLKLRTPIIAIENSGTGAAYTTDMLKGELALDGNTQREIFVVACEDKIDFKRRGPRKLTTDLEDKISLQTIALGEILAEKIETIQDCLAKGASVEDVKRDYSL